MAAFDCVIIVSTPNEAPGSSILVHERSLASAWHFVGASTAEETASSCARARAARGMCPVPSGHLWRLYQWRLVDMVRRLGILNNSFPLRAVPPRSAVLVHPPGQPSIHRVIIPAMHPIPRPSGTTFLAPALIHPFPFPRASVFPLPCFQPTTLHGPYIYFDA